MPRLTPGENDQVLVIPGPGNFQFSAIRPDELQESEYTLVTIVVDVSSSVYSFEKDLLKSIKTIIEACQKSPRANNLLVRLIKFNQFIIEIHGFKNLADIDVDAYDELKASGSTALFDATYDAVGATLAYASQLDSLDYDCNAAVYIITDGCNNTGTMTERSIKDKIDDANRKEVLDSIITILVGLHDPNDSWGDDVKRHLEQFKNDANLTEFLNIGEATPRKLARLANWVSQSVSSQSQALANGTQSQPLAF